MMVNRARPVGSEYINITILVHIAGFGIMGTCYGQYLFFKCRFRFSIGQPDAYMILVPWMIMPYGGMNVQVPVIIEITH